MSKKTKNKTLVEVGNEVAKNLNDVKPDTLYRVQEVRHLTESAYVLRFDKHGLAFTPGQHISLGLPGDNQMREYSVYSPNNVDYLETLVKEVENGDVSRKLKKLKPGDILKVEGPFGFFGLETDNLQSQKSLFIASGTGIAPFHSMVKSHEGLDYTILHGIRYASESYERNDYETGR